MSWITKRKIENLRDMMILLNPDDENVERIFQRY